MKIINIILVSLLLISLYLHWFGDGGANELNEKKILYRLQLEKNKELQARNDQLKAEVEDLKNGLEALEERARSEMGMIKDDETFIQIIEENQ